MSRWPYSALRRSHKYYIVVYHTAGTARVHRNEIGLYDVEIYIDEEPHGDGRSEAYRLEATTKELIPAYDLTKYLFVKLRHFQLDDDLLSREILTVERGVDGRRRHYFVIPDPNKYSAHEINNVLITLDHLINMLAVEYDFHFGAKDCMKPENTKYRMAYIKQPYCGYGPKYLTANIEESRLVKYYCKK